MLTRTVTDACSFSSPDNDRTPFVSVIIPVFNDEARLMRCLAALEQQTYDADCYEVVVVDNGSTRDVAGVVGGFVHAQSIRELQPGSYAARNTGLAHARGEIIAFTDSDCVPQLDWLSRGVDHLLRRGEPTVVAGHIAVFCAMPTHPTPTELYERVTAFPQQKYVEKYHYGATANVLTWRTVLDAVGPFNSQLKSGGDREWGQRASAAGYPLVYAPDVVIHHPARSSFVELKHKLVRVTIGLEHVRAAQPYPLSTFIKTIIKDLLPYKRIHQTWTDERLHGAGERLRATGVLLGLQAVQAWTRLQVRFGGAADVR